MADQKSLLKFTGSLSGLVFYERNGKFYVKGAGGADRKRILKEPNFVRTRENMQEFGASAVMGRSFRNGFLPVSKLIRTTSLSGKVTGIMKRINKAGAGVRGSRSFEIIKNKTCLEGFELNQKVALSSVFYPPYPMPELNSTRNLITWQVPPFHPTIYISGPHRASHFQVLLHAFVLSDYVFDKDVEKYLFVGDKYHEFRGTSYSSVLSSRSHLTETINLSIQLGEPELSNSAALVVSIGILFFEEVNGKPLLISGQNSMKVVLVA
ncbi:hypothetical protein [Namhaeicola litoreus]|uniref:Uncharacterized protein n=1 Tax=Namhaeicola litoreus TaxID=1052145 RepID=A0ABW3Y3L2_9FLAO